MNLFINYSSFAFENLAIELIYLLNIPASNLIHISHRSPETNDHSEHKKLREIFIEEGFNNGVPLIATTNSSAMSVYIATTNNSAMSFIAPYWIHKWIQILFPKKDSAKPNTGLCSDAAKKLGIKVTSISLNLSTKEESEQVKEIIRQATIDLSHQQNHK